MKGIELEIYVHTDETTELEKIGIETSHLDGELLQCTFYRIDAIMPNDEESYIISGGEQFCSPVSYEELKRRIEKCLK